MLRSVRRRLTYANVVATTAGADVLDAEMVLRWIDDGGSVVERQTDASAAAPATDEKQARALRRAAF